MNELCALYVTYWLLFESDHNNYYAPSDKNIDMYMSKYHLTYGKPKMWINRIDEIKAANQTMALLEKLELCTEFKDLITLDFIKYMIRINQLVDQGIYDACK